MKIFYWSPFFSNVATIKAVTRSLVSLTKFPQDQKYKVSLIDAIGEWEQNEDIIKNKISVIKLSDINKTINFVNDILFKSSSRSFFFLIPKKELIILLNHIIYEQNY